MTSPENYDPGTNEAHSAVVWLSAAIGLLALVCGLAGFLWGGTGEAREVTTLSGDTVQLYGRGLYRNDTVLAAGNNRGSDLTMLVLGIPLLVLSVVLYRRGSVKGRFLLLGTLGFFLYIGASYALGAVAYNEMFLAYTGLFSASLFALIVLYRTFDAKFLTGAIPDGMPRRWPGGFMVAVVAFSLLILEAMLMPLITIATVVQIREGVRFEPGEIVGPIAGFSVFAVLSLAVIFKLMRRIGPVRQSA